MTPVKQRSGTRIFFYMTYLVMGLVWVVSMAYPTWRPWQVVLPFTLLLLLHSFLHSQVQRAAERGWGWWYLAGQSVIAVALVLVAQEGLLLEALFAALTGETMGLLQGWRARAIGLGIVVGSWAVATSLTSGQDTLLFQLPFVLGALAFAAVYVVIYLRQEEQRQRAERLLGELEVAHRQLRSYARQVEELSVTQERQRMARELHDTLAQGLAGLIMQLEAVDDLLSRGEAERARGIVHRSMDRTRKTLAEARSTVQALRLPMERGDLVEEIRRELERLGQEVTLEPVLEIGPGEIAVSDEIAMQLFRIAQEGFRNIQRHARAHHVTVRLWSEGPTVYLSIRDDGVGFDAAAIPPGHFGLTGIGERVGLVGGSCRVESRPGEGTQLHVSLPRQLPKLEESL